MTMCMLIQKEDIYFRVLITILIGGLALPYEWNQITKLKQW